MMIGVNREQCQCMVKYGTTSTRPTNHDYIYMYQCRLVGHVARTGHNATKTGLFYPMGYDDGDGSASLYLCLCCVGGGGGGLKGGGGPNFILDNN